MKKITLTLLSCFVLLLATSQTWVQKLNFSSSIGYFSALHFPTTTNGWAVGYKTQGSGAGSGFLYSTSNSGQTWTESSTYIGQVLLDVFFIDNQTGWLCGNNGSIYKTTDGGSAWSVQTSGVTNDIKSIYFTSATEGWFTSMLGIYKTTDGGTTWTLSQSVSNGKKVYFETPLIGYAVAGVGSTTIYKTTDGGATWTTSTLANIYSSISFIDQNTGFLGGSSNKFAKTTDGGTTWTESTISSTGDIYGVDFADASTGWISTNNLIRKTVDGGATWGTEKTGSNFSDIQVFSSTNAWTIGYGTQGTGIYQYVNCTNSTSNLSFTACDQFDFHGTSYTTSGTYTQTIPNATGCDSVVTLNISISTTTAPAPVITGITGLSTNNNNPPCAGNTFTFTAQNATGTFVWTLPSDWTITSGATTNTITGTYGENVGTVSVIATNICNISSAPFTSTAITPTVGLPATPTALDVTSTPACINSNQAFGIVPNPGSGNGLFWTWSSNEWTNLDTDGTTVNPYGNFNLSSNTGSITVTANNACGASAPYTQAFTFTLDAQPTTPVITENGGILSTTATGGEYCWYEVNTEGAEYCFTGASGMNFTPPVSGDYNLVVSSPNGCQSETSNTLSVTAPTTGITENESTTFKMYPNPASKQVIISNIEVGSFIYLVDVAGKILTIQQANSTTLTVETLDFISGVYFIRILSANGKTEVQKLLID